MILGDIGPHWHGRDLPPPPKCFKLQKTDIIKNTVKPQKITENWEFEFSK